MPAPGHITCRALAPTPRSPSPTRSPTPSSLPPEWHASLHQYLRDTQPPPTAGLTRAPSARVLPYEDTLARDAFETMNAKSFRSVLSEQARRPKVARAPPTSLQYNISFEKASLAGALSTSHSIHSGLGATCGARPATCKPVSSCHMNPSETRWVNTQSTACTSYPGWQPASRAQLFPQPGQVRAQPSHLHAP